MLRAAAPSWRKFVCTSVVTAGLVLFAPAFTAAADVPETADAADIASASDNSVVEQPGSIVTDAPEPEATATETHEPSVEATTSPEEAETAQPPAADHPTSTVPQSSGSGGASPSITTDETGDPEPSVSEPASEESSPSHSPDGQSSASEAGEVTAGADGGAGAVVPAEPGNGRAVQPRTISTEASVKHFETVPTGMVEDALKASADKSGQDAAAKKQRIAATGVDNKIWMLSWSAAVLGLAGLLLLVRLRRNA